MESDTKYKIRIKQFEPEGFKDTDLSIIIDKDNLQLKKFSLENMHDILKQVPIEYVFEEKVRMSNEPKSFNSLKLGNWYFVWIPDVKRWIGIYLSIKEDPNVHFERIYTDITEVSGPYALSKFGAKIIKSFYKCNDKTYRNVLKTPPEELKIS